MPRWVLVGSTHKVFCCRIWNLSLNSAYTKDQLVSWVDDLFLIGNKNLIKTN